MEPQPVPDPADGALPESLRGPELRAIAAIWKRSRREVVARFRGVSMEPTIPSGSEVVLRCGEAIGAGDILAFVAGDRLIVHRVLGLSEDHGWILTCGDAARIPDPPITDADSVIGIVARLRRGSALAAPAPPPRSLGRWLVQGSCLALLHRAPRLGIRVVRALVFLRRWLVNVPKVAAARLAARAGLLR